MIKKLSHKDNEVKSSQKDDGKTLFLKTMVKIVQKG